MTDHDWLQAMRTKPERRNHARPGTTSLFAAFNIADGTVIGEWHRNTGRWNTANS
ncbi:hypothetical protein [Actinoplanes sp. M2I2]|uniref:hypothetical protein n=1 Tax=Actinoplanes sp. M2I2 TaxID=1734444 RepID=UPI002020F514|nr:hypothetical protein [Actinoplanes sp. M2I2]